MQRSKLPVHRNQTNTVAYHAQISHLHAYNPLLLLLLSPLSPLPNTQQFARNVTVTQKKKKKKRRKPQAKAGPTRALSAPSSEAPSRDDGLRFCRHTSPAKRTQAHWGPLRAGVADPRIGSQYGSIAACRRRRRPSSVSGPGRGGGELYRLPSKTATQAIAPASSLRSQNASYRKSSRSPNRVPIISAATTTSHRMSARRGECQ